MIHSQGDVNFIPAAVFSTEFLSTFGDKKADLVLAEGETTGHKHRVTKGQVELFHLMAGVMLLKVISDTAIISHEEHEDIILPMGEWVVPIQQEINHIEKTLQRVAD